MGRGGAGGQSRGARPQAGSPGAAIESCCSARMARQVPCPKAPQAPPTFTPPEVAVDDQRVLRQAALAKDGVAAHRDGHGAGGQRVQRHLLHIVLPAPGARKSGYGMGTVPQRFQPGRPAGAAACACQAAPAMGPPPPRPPVGRGGVVHRAAVAQQGDAVEARRPHRQVQVVHQRLLGCGGSGGGGVGWISGCRWCGGFSRVGRAAFPAVQGGSTGAAPAEACQEERSSQRHGGSPEERPG